MLPNWNERKCWIPFSTAQAPSPPVVEPSQKLCFSIYLNQDLLPATAGIFVSPGGILPITRCCALSFCVPSPSWQQQIHKSRHLASAFAQQLTDNSGHGQKNSPCQKRQRLLKNPSICYFEREAQKMKPGWEEASQLPMMLTWLIPNRLSAHCCSEPSADA